MRVRRMSRRLTMPSTVRPCTTGRCRKPCASIMSAASSVSVSGGTVTGSRVIHSFTGEEDMSAPAAAARRTSRSVKIPSSHPSPITSAEPCWSLRSVRATSAILVSPGTEKTSFVMISSSDATSAAPSDVVMGRLVVRRRGVGQLLVQEAPERSRPLADVGPALPEQLERRLVQPLRRLLRGARVGDVLELRERFQQPLGDVLCHRNETPSSKGRSVVAAGDASAKVRRRSQARCGASSHAGAEASSFRTEYQLGSYADSSVSSSSTRSRMSTRRSIAASPSSRLRTARSKLSWLLSAAGERFLECGGGKNYPEELDTPELSFASVPASEANRTRTASLAGCSTDAL